MARAKREDHPGAFHHVMGRGARRQPIFKALSDCQGFLDLTDDLAGRFGVEVHAYALMPNHYHLLLRSVRGNLSEAMKYLVGSYTQLLNRRHAWDGPVFRGRFRSQMITSEFQLKTLIAYIHLNPLRARLVPRLTSEAWTSHRAYMGLERPPRWLTTELLLGLLGGKKKLDDYVRSVHQGAIRYPDEIDLETGIFRGGEPGRADEGPSSGKRLKIDRAPEHRSANEVIAEVCRITGATEKSLLEIEYGPRANPARRFAVWALYRNGGMKQREIAKRMKATYFQVSKLVSQLRRDDASDPLRTWMLQWGRLR